MDALSVYESLLDRFGPQGWWPVTPAGKLLPEYQGKKRLNEREALEVCIGSILTQNTNWSNAEKSIVVINEKNSMSIESFCSTDTANLKSIIRQSGFFNQKSNYIIEFCNYVQKNYGSLSEFFKKNLEDAREELLSIKGIGPETADSMLLYAGGKKTFVIDAYTKRVSNRTGLCSLEDYHRLQKYFQNNIPEDVQIYKEYHALIVKLCKDYCKKVPICNECPLEDECQKNV